MQHIQTAPSSTHRVPAPGMEVLILDDERFDRHRLARLCSGLDTPCGITNATALADFSDELEQRFFDLILIDYRLPDGTGLDALHLVRLSARNNAAATIMITGQGQKSVQDAALASGCRDYLDKDDLSAQTFQNAVARALHTPLRQHIAGDDAALAPEVQLALSAFAVKCASDIKPMVSRVMRQVRALRAADQDAAQDARSRFDGIEDSCISLWEFLVDLERSTIADQPPVPAAAPPAKDMHDAAVAASRVGRKPPSPFSRYRN